MSRFRLPARVAPSPAAEEPGLQNSAARLRSSREAQSRILAERRAPEKGGTDETVGTQPLGMPTAHLAEPEFAGKTEGERRQPQSSASPAECAASGLAKPGKRSWWSSFGCRWQPRSSLSRSRARARLLQPTCCAPLPRKPGPNFGGSWRKMILRRISMRRGASSPWQQRTWRSANR